MKVSIERSALLKAMSQAQSVVERRNTIPILANVLIEAEGGEISFRATDLDIEVVYKVVGMVERAGATTVGAHTLHEIVRKLPDARPLTQRSRRTTLSRAFELAWMGSLQLEPSLPETIRKLGRSCPLPHVVEAQRLRLFFQLRKRMTQRMTLMKAENPSPKMSSRLTRKLRMMPFVLASPGLSDIKKLRKL